SPRGDKPGQEKERDSAEKLERATGPALGSHPNGEERERPEEVAFGSRERRERECDPRSPGGSALDQNARQFIEREREHAVARGDSIPEMAHRTAHACTAMRRPSPREVQTSHPSLLPIRTR